MSVEDRVDELEATLEEALERIERLERAAVGGEVASEALDQYDRKVVQELAQSGEKAVSTATIRRLYRRAGVRNNRKTRGRIKALADDELIEHVEPDHWRYVGPRQDTFEGIQA